MNYNFVEEFKKKLVTIKVDCYNKHILMDVPFYGGHLRLDAEIRDGFFMHVIGTAVILNEIRVIESLSIEFGTADVIAGKVAESLNQLEQETREKRLGALTIKEMQHG
jgi:hypothetical protein